MTKLLRIILIGCMCVLASAEVQAFDMFTVGAQWVCGSFGTGSSTPTEGTDTVYIESNALVDGVECLRVMRKSDNGGEPHFLTYLRKEGEKIWFMNNLDTKEWSLLYDFGLQSEESTTVSTISFPTSSSSRPWETDVRCIGVEKDSNNPDVERMNIELSRESWGNYTEEGSWLKGIGSTAGLIGNVHFGMTGFTTWLISASTPADGVVYLREAAGVSEVSGESVKDDSAYDMLGRKIEVPVSGQMYIQGGKLKIAR